MSNMNQNAVATEEAPKKNVGYRLFAVLLIAVCALAFAVLQYNVLFFSVAEANLLTVVTEVLGGAAFEGEMIATIYSFTMYAFIAGVALAAIFALMAIFTAKKAPAFVRTSLFFLAAGAMFNSLTYSVAAEGAIETFSLAIAGGATFLYFLFATKKAGSVAVLYFVQAIISAVVAVLFTSPIAEVIGEPLALVGFVVLTLNAVISVGRMTRAGGIVFDLVRYIVALLIAVVLLKVTSDILAIVAAAAIVVQIIITIIQLIASKTVDVDSIREEAAQEVTNTFHMEEFVEAYPYEGGPVAGVMMAEEVNPTFLPHEPHVTTAGYDFYNCKSFDPFIATLDMAERNEFTELFILKFKGTMTELPDYVVGGDNKEFFRKIFIYLGQYRDRMSQALLMKMYQFSMKI